MQLTFTRKNRCKRIFSVITALIIIVSSIAGAVVIAPVSVYALSAGGIHSTIASIIISLMLQCGVAPTNTAWVTSLNSAYGYTIESAITQGLLTETSGALVDSGLAASIEASAEYTTLGLGEMFGTTAADVGVSAASGGVNIANTAIHVGKLGSIGAFAGAVAVGVGVGVLARHIGQKIYNYVKYGVPLNYNYIINNAELGGSFFFASYGSGASMRTRTWDYTANNIISCSYTSSTGRYVYAMYSGSEGSSDRVLKEYNQDNQLTNTIKENFSWNRGGITISGQNTTRDLSNNFGPHFASQEEALQYVNGILDGTVVKDPIVSPDIIGPGGNQVYDSENDTIPGVQNIVPEGADMTPVDMDDYQSFINNANNNTSNGDTGQETQGEAFDDLVSPLIIDAPTIPDTPIIPDQPVDVPTVPDRPVEPVQPTIPDKPGITQEDLDQALQGATTIDLRSIFPFCIPFDLYNLLLIFDTGENRKAPHITFTFPITGWEIDVDLVAFDPVAAVLRLLELILFIIGLAVATRRLIGAGGG